MASPRWNRLLVTGAAGRLGVQLCSELRDLASFVRFTDIQGLAPAGDRGEAIEVDLADATATDALMHEVDVVIHFGAVMPQEPWSAILNANIVGTFNVFEAARKAGVKRVIYASSHHAVGMYDSTQLLDCDSPPRPSNLYGLSKAFGESLARMYYDKHGIEVVCLRIGSCFPEPTDRRMLSTWLSHADMLQLCRRCLEAQEVGYSIVYGVSANSRRWWNNEKTAFLGFRPVDSADAFETSLAELPISPEDPASHLQGGRFTKLIP